MVQHFCLKATHNSNTWVCKHFGQLKMSPAEANQSTGTETALLHCKRPSNKPLQEAALWDLNHLSSTTGEPPVMNEAEESKQTPMRHLQLPGQNGTSQALQTCCQGRSWMGSCHPAHQSQKSFLQSAPALMLALHYVQAAPCDGEWCATGSQIHQVTADAQQKLLLTCSRERWLFSKWEERVKAWLVRPHTFNDL